ncbi:MAG: S1/P1 nuclease, partial [Gammaproteobacteria bacterium]|nr:S1/P1 nuclease [Gammaproteobacteria bacterium]
DPASSDADRLLALKLLGHWVGDIHQPLHISYQDDRGANYIDVDLDMPDANLHGVWDYSIVSANLGDDYLPVAAELRGSVSDWQRVDWQDDSVVEWANESYQITIAPSVGYCVRKQGACWYREDKKLLTTGEPRRRMAISDGYLEQHKAIVIKRLQQAGIRLAALLERSLQ